MKYQRSYTNILWPQFSRQQYFRHQKYTRRAIEKNASQKQSSSGDDHAIKSKFLDAVTETEMSSFWRNVRQRMLRKLSNKNFLCSQCHKFRFWTYLHGPIYICVNSSQRIKHNSDSVGLLNHQRKSTYHLQFCLTSCSKASCLSFCVHYINLIKVC